jgi:pimeloyl-ACP methyl ester carboxylesterase
MNMTSTKRLPPVGYANEAEEIYSMIEKTDFDRTFSHHMAEVNGVKLHFVSGGTGEPVVLLHGFPQTWYEWHRIMPVLAERYTIIAPDLRGMGASSQPTSGYDHQTVAEEDLDEYVRWYSAVGAMRSALQYYRYTQQNFAQNQESSKQKLTMPVLAIGGEHSLGSYVEMMMQDFASNIRGSDFTKLPAGENRNFDLRKEFHQYLDRSSLAQPPGTGIAATSILNGASAHPEGEKELYSSWQGKQYLHSMFSVQNTPLDNDYLR